MAHPLQIRRSTVAMLVAFAVLIAILDLARRNIRVMTAAMGWRQHTLLGAGPDAPEVRLA